MTAPTQEQIMQAISLIESADPDDVMALAITAISTANRHDKLDELAANLEADYEGDYVSCQNAFSPYYRSQS